MVGFSTGKLELASSTSDDVERGETAIACEGRGLEEEKEVSTSIFNQQLPAGYKFAPTDEEIVGYFLRQRLSGAEITHNPIHECDGDRFYSTHPKDLVSRSREVSSWYFYVREGVGVDVHLPTTTTKTTREVRDGAGSWRVIEPESQIQIKPNSSSSSSSTVGVKTVFAFFQQQRLHDNYNKRLKKTHWTMTEYRLLNHDSSYNENEITRVVLTRVNRGKQIDGGGK